MTADLRLRAMLLADIPAVVGLAESLPTAPHWPQSTYEFALHPSNLPERIALLAEGPDGALAGFAIACITGLESELETIAVAACFQRQGVARNLFRQLTAQLGVRGVQSVFLEVRASNDAAIELYRALGFTQAGRRKGYYSDPPEDALVFRVQLDL